jgi:hypothetical protein
MATAGGVWRWIAGSRDGTEVNRSQGTYTLLVLESLTVIVSDGDNVAMHRPRGRNAAVSQLADGFECAGNCQPRAVRATERRRPRAE